MKPMKYEIIGPDIYSPSITIIKGSQGHIHSGYWHLVYCLQLALYVACLTFLEKVKVRVREMSERWEVSKNEKHKKCRIFAIYWGRGSISPAIFLSKKILLSKPNNHQYGEWRRWLRMRMISMEMILRMRQFIDSQYADADTDLPQSNTE